MTRKDQLLEALTKALVAGRNQEVLDVAEELSEVATTGGHTSDSVALATVNLARAMVHWRERDADGLWLSWNLAYPLAQGAAERDPAMWPLVELVWSLAADVHQYTHYLAEARGALENAQQAVLNAPGNTTEVQARVLITEGRVLLAEANQSRVDGDLEAARSRFLEAARVLTHAASQADESESPYLQQIARCHYAFVHYIRGNHEAGQELAGRLGEAIRSYDFYEYVSNVAEQLQWLLQEEWPSDAYFDGSLPDEAVALLERILRPF